MASLARAVRDCVQYALPLKAHMDGADIVTYFDGSAAGLRSALQAALRAPRLRCQFGYSALCAIAAEVADSLNFDHFFLQDVEAVVFLSADKPMIVLHNTRVANKHGLFLVNTDRIAKQLAALLVRDRQRAFFLAAAVVALLALTWWCAARAML